MAPTSTTAKVMHAANPRAEAGEARPNRFAVPVLLLEQVLPDSRDGRCFGLFESVYTRNLRFFEKPNKKLSDSTQI